MLSVLIVVLVFLFQYFIAFFVLTLCFNLDFFHGFDFVRSLGHFYTSVCLFIDFFVVFAYCLVLSSFFGVEDVFWQVSVHHNSFYLFVLTEF